jgi:putative Holliday junction resolvase
MLDLEPTIVALDIGSRRIGVAIASKEVGLPSPLKTVINEGDIVGHLSELFTEHNAIAVVAGLPRGLDGQHTAQTASVEAFVDKLRQHVKLPIYLQDEALTSVQAEEELTSRGKPYSKADIDALAATYILGDFLQDHLKELQ